MAKDARAVVDPLFVLAYRTRSGFRGAIPPGPIRARAGWPNVRSYVVGGRFSAMELDGALASVGRSLPEFEAILDFGAGAGRVLSHVAQRGRQGGDFHGTDVDCEAIEWARRHRPEASWQVNAAEPPLSFADERFDLVYSISIFTHLDEALQWRWLIDLRRVLRPGGLALLTVHGEHEFDAYRNGTVVSGTPDCARRVALHGSLEEAGFIHEPYTRSVWTRKDLPGTDASFGLAFHSEDYIQRRWSEQFQVRKILPRALAERQDIVVLEKPESA
jgi:SAM-dependent methyltransferase